MKRLVDDSVGASLEAFDRSRTIQSPDNEKDRKITMNSVFADHADQLDTRIAGKPGLAKYKLSRQPVKLSKSSFGAFRSDDSISLLVEAPRKNREIAPVGLDKKHAWAPLFMANDFDLRVKSHRRASKRKWLTRR